MKKLLFLALLFLFVSKNNLSTHILGGDVSVTQVGPYGFRINLTFFRECAGFTQAAPASLTGNIYYSNNDSLFTTVVLNRDSTDFLNKSCISSAFCTEIYHYSGFINLPNITNGYYFSWQHCCRVTPLNIASPASMVFSATFPSPNIPSGNSSPRFKPNYLDHYLCVNSQRQIDYSCTDPDSDSLVYSLIPPSNGGTSKPFVATNWNPGYSITNIINGVCTIDSNGIVSLTPYVLGNFVVAVKCEEFRNGIKIGEVIREIELTSLNCKLLSIGNYKDNVCATSYTTASGKIITNSGIYFDTIQTVLGCDSIIRYDLTINYIDTSVSLIYPYIKSEDTSGTYQWFDCNNGFTPISGATAQWFTIPANGSYAVEVTNNGCVDTSSCITLTTVGLKEAQLQQNISIFPNPTNGTFTLDLGKQTELNRIFITDINGRLIKEITPQNVIQYEINFEGSAGVYLLNLVGENERRTIKLVKE